LPNVAGLDLVDDRAETLRVPATPEATRNPIVAGRSDAEYGYDVFVRILVARSANIRTETR
jgi:hypothetical protein